MGSFPQVSAKREWRDKCKKYCELRVGECGGKVAWKGLGIRCSILLSYESTCIFTLRFPPAPESPR
jgi:hypothetical protein